MVSSWLPLLRIFLIRAVRDCLQSLCSPLRMLMRSVVGEPAERPAGASFPSPTLLPEHTPCPALGAARGKYGFDEVGGRQIITQRRQDACRSKLS